MKNESVHLNRNKHKRGCATACKDESASSEMVTAKCMLHSGVPMRSDEITVMAKNSASSADVPVRDYYKYFQ